MGVNDPQVQALFKKSRQKKISFFLISQDYYELPKRNSRANGNFYYMFIQNNFRDVQILYQDEAFLDMTLNEFKLFTSTCKKGKISTQSSLIKLEITVLDVIDWD